LVGSHHNRAAAAAAAAASNDDDDDDDHARLVSMLSIRELLKRLSWRQFVELAPRHAKLIAEFAASDAPVDTTVDIVARLMFQGGFVQLQLPQPAVKPLFKALLCLPGLAKLDHRQLDYFKKECELYYGRDVPDWFVRTPLLELILHRKCSCWWHVPDVHLSSICAGSQTPSTARRKTRSASPTTTTPSLPSRRSNGNTPWHASMNGT
jgi:hypothetical protein